MRCPRVILQIDREEPSLAVAFSLEMHAREALQYSIQQIALRSEMIGHDSLLETMSDEELADLWTNDYLLERLEWDTTRQPEYDRDQTITISGRPARNLGEPIRSLYLPVIPKKSNPRVLTLRPEQGWTQRGPEIGPAAAFIERDSVIVLTGTASQLRDLRTMAVVLVELINNDIERYYNDLSSRVLEIIQARRAQRRQEDEQFQREARELGLVIRQKPGAPNLVDVREHHCVQTLRQESSRNRRETDVRLASESLIKIIDLIDKAGKGFEVARQEFLKLGEEGLRHVIVGYLNAVFDRTDVTGETFSKDGKPDLVIMREGRPVMVGECKFWDGSTLYSDTLGSQLMRYIPWRHTTAVLITFATRMNLTRVISEAIRATKEHKSFMGAIVVRSETYFISNHVHPDDENKTVEIHHLLFNLYSDIARQD